MGTLKVSPEMRAKLNAPLPKEAVKPHPTMANMSAIKAIYVTERLNDVFGIGGWSIKADMVNELSSATKVNSFGKERTEHTSLVKTTFTVPDYDIHYECIAGSTNTDEGDAAKGGITDGITKIASWMEIGIEVFKGLVETPKQTAAQTPPAKTPVKVTTKTPAQEAPPATTPPVKEVPEIPMQDRVNGMLKKETPIAPELKTPAANVSGGAEAPVSDTLKTHIAAASTKPQLVEIWNNNTDLHKHVGFNKILNSRKKELGL